MPAINPVRPRSSYEPLARTLARFLLVVSVLGTLFAGLFPFDFSFPRDLAREVRRQFDHSPEPAVFVDRFQNMLFFVPFGFALAATMGAGRRGGATALRLVAALVLGFILSVVVELGQVFLGFRDPTTSDLVMNTIGSAVGAGIAIACAREVLLALARLLARLAPFVTFRNLAAALAVCTAIELALPLLARERGTLSSWDSSFPLLVGNETNGERFWFGTVERVDLAARAATGAEIARLHREPASVADVFGDALVASYELAGIGPYVDHTGQLKPLKWVGPDPPAEALDAATTAPASHEPVYVAQTRWLRTPVAVASASHRIRQSSQFTLVTQFTPAHQDQRGPARIVSISGGLFQRNLSLMHEYTHLAVRVRTGLLGPDGSAPEVLLGDVFDSTGPVHVTVTYSDPLLVAYLDGVEAGRLEITPEAALIWRLYPRSGWRVKLNQYGFRSYAVVYRLLVFIPFGAVLAATLRRARLSPKARWTFGAATVVLIALLMELILGSMTASGFQPRNLAIGVAIGVGTFAFLSLRPSAGQSPASARGIR